MGLLNVYEMMQIVRKYFVRILALAIAIGFVAFYAVSELQTYTCILGFKYTHEGAAEGLAPDGTSKLDPYEIQNPVVIQGALDSIGAQENDDMDIKGIRQNISVAKVVTELDKEVSESAALLGEKYEAAATEYEMTFTYDSKYGDEFGAKMFNGIIKEYDEFLLNKYYNKETVSDFAKVVDKSSADYIDIADVMALEIDSTVEYLDSMAEWHPDFRSKTTGYSFSELSSIYQNIRNIQHAKYYGNIRAANLAKDPEMVIKSYQTKVKDLTESQNVSYTVAENYKSMITTFYDSYKAAGLYGQAERVQTDPNSSNNRDESVLDNYDIEEHKNTYDNIVISYVENAAESTDAAHTINYYNTIIDSYVNDAVDQGTKDRLLKANEEIFKEISVLSAKYSEIANKTIGELFATQVTTDLQYLIVPEVVEDVPVKTVVVFVVILAFGLLVFAVIFKELSKKFVKKHKAEFIEAYDANEEKKILNTKDMDELHRLVYEQYRKDFDEFYLVYQPMISCKSGDGRKHMEAFIRWKSAKLGMVAPGKIIDCVSDLGIFKELNEWIIKNVCEGIAESDISSGELPLVHINCPHSQVTDFGLNDIIIKYVEEYQIPANCICLELDGKDIVASLEDIMLLKQMGIVICVDHFENSDENQEIISVVEPGYVKMSLDILNCDMYATSKDEVLNAAFGMIHYLSDIIDKCHKKGIKVCVCGVEDKSQDHTISMLDFDFKQGYFYGKPEEFIK